MESYASLYRVVEQVRPDECYHLAAQSFVSYSFDDEFSTINTNVNGTHFMLSSIKEKAPACRFYFAGSSEMFGQPDRSPQDEDTPLRPRCAWAPWRPAAIGATPPSTSRPCGACSNRMLRKTWSSPAASPTACASS